jgi:ADP-ribose pyrophosphatase YjhB (NUDIX family)/ribosomal protein S27AE
MDKDNARLFRYCPRCGGDKLRAASAKKFECPDCGFGFFLNTAATVGALITDEEGRLLVTVRKGEPAKGMWDLPGGFVDPGESVEDAVRREIQEELGLDIISLSYFCSFANRYEFGGVTYWTVDLAYICEAGDASKAEARDDVEAVLFIPPAELVLEKFGLESVRKIISYYISTGEANLV